MIQYVIQHHPKRAHLLDNYVHLDPVVVTDPEPNAKQGIPWRTYHACMSLPVTREWRVVIQDDALLCDHFAEVVPQALQEVPGCPVTLFIPNTLKRGSLRLLRACAADQAWCELELNEWVPVVALAWPAEQIPLFLEFCERRKFHPNLMRADDAIVGRFQRETRTQFYGTVPSLVDHPDVEPSLINNWTSRKGRRATCFADDPLAIDWTEKRNLKNLPQLA